MLIEEGSAIPVAEEAAAALHLIAKPLLVLTALSVPAAARIAWAAVACAPSLR